MTKVLTDENLELYGSCMSSGDDNNLDGILADGVQRITSNDGVAPTTWLLAEPSC